MYNHKMVSFITGFYDPPSLSDIVLSAMPWLGPVIWSRRARIALAIRKYYRSIAFRIACYYMVFVLKRSLKKPEKFFIVFAIALVLAFTAPAQLAKLQPK